MIYRQGDMLPGPGDPETWGPYRGGNDPRGPSPRDVRDEREIERRADELAAEAFEQRDDDAKLWIEEAPQDDCREYKEFVNAALDYCAQPDSDDAKANAVKAWERLRDAYVKYARELYTLRASDELLARDTRADDAYDDSRMER